MRITIRRALGERIVPGAYHATGREIGALLMLLAVAKKTLKRPDTIRYQIVGLEKVKVL